jgi:hypothetical protein
MLKASKVTLQIELAISMSSIEARYALQILETISPTTNLTLALSIYPKSCENGSLNDTIVFNDREKLIDFIGESLHHEFSF